MKLASCEQIRTIDRAAIERFGIPGIILMENAGRSVFEICRGLEAYAFKKAVILCGTGNNGGDGFVIARHMHNDNADVLIVVVGEPEKITGDARMNYDICQRMRIDIREWAGADMLTGYPLIIDAILGTGVSGGIRDNIKTVIEAVNRIDACIIAVDCPTGGNPDTGHITDICVRASHTVTLAMPKPGLLLYPLAEYVGQLELGEISAPRELLIEFDSGMYALDADVAAKLLPKRHENSHKGTYGRVAIVAGSRNMAGAAAFSANAAYKSGCGYVDICTVETAIPVVQQLVPQAVTAPLAERDGFICADALNFALERINKSTVCLIGPGLGQHLEVSEFIRGVITYAKVPLILDADALNAITPDILLGAATIPVITPHPLEMSRLTGTPVANILDNMPNEAKKFANVYHTVTVLKSASTIIAEPYGSVFINKGGCSALAKAGSGDILAGLIAGFMAQGMTGAPAAALSAFIQSCAGKTAAKKYGEYSVGYDEILRCVHEVITCSYQSSL